MFSLILQYVNPNHNSAAWWYEYPYHRSLYLIPFASLVCATPKMTIMRKAAIIAVGVIVLLFVNLLFVQYTFSFVTANNHELQAVSEMIFRSIEWMLPFLLWIIPSHPYLGELFKQQDVRESV
jgi:hypothetical protein